MHIHFNKRILYNFVKQQNRLSYLTFPITGKRTDTADITTQTCQARNIGLS